MRHGNDCKSVFKCHVWKKNGAIVYSMRGIRVLTSERDREQEREERERERERKRVREKRRERDR